MAADLSKLRNVAIMSVHNLTGDWESTFGVVMPTELPINPTASGIVFFRWHRPAGHSYEAAANEVRFFLAVHEQLKSSGGNGLDAVIVFGNNIYRHVRQSIDIADGIKKADKTISVYASAIDTPDDMLIKAQNRRSIDKILGGMQNSYASALMRALKLPVNNLKTELDIQTTRQLYALEDEYRKRYPGLFDGPHINPEKLAQSIPERQDLRRFGDPSEKPTA